MPVLGMRGPVPLMCSPAGLEASLVPEVRVVNVNMAVLLQ